MTKFDKWKAERIKELENMGLHEAIDIVKNLMEECKNPPVYYRIELSDDGSEGVALEVVLKALYKSERMIEIKDEYFQLIDFLLVDYDGCKTVDTLKELIDETREYIHKALKNDDKSVITVNSKKKFNILGEEVE